MVILLQCKLKCPPNTEGPMRAVCIHDEETENLMVFGFVNDCQKTYRHINVPIFLINIILSYILNEYIHIFHICKHFKINIDDILCNLY